MHPYVGILTRDSPYATALHCPSAAGDADSLLIFGEFISYIASYLVFRIGSIYGESQIRRAIQRGREKGEGIHRGRIGGAEIRIGQQISRTGVRGKRGPRGVFAWGAGVSKSAGGREI